MIKIFGIIYCAITSNTINTSRNCIFWFVERKFSIYQSNITRCSLYKFHVLSNSLIRNVKIIFQYSEVPHPYFTSILQCVIIGYIPCLELYRRIYNLCIHRWLGSWRQILITYSISLWKIWHAATGTLQKGHNAYM